MNEKTNATEKNTASCLATGEILIKIIKGIIENEKVDIPENTDSIKL